MRAVLPPHLADVDQAQVGLVDERRCLKSVAGAFPGHVVAGEAMEFAVNERHQTIECTLIAAAPGQQESGRCRDLGRNAVILPRLVP